MKHAVVEAELVRDGVDARVVRVHELLARGDGPHTLFDQSGHRVPARQPSAPQVRLGEPGVAELRASDDRDLTSEERRVPLHVEGSGGAPRPATVQRKTLSTPVSISIR